MNKKAKENNIGECYEKIEHFFTKHGIKIIAKGVYQGGKIIFKQRRKLNGIYQKAHGF